MRREAAALCLGLALAACEPGPFRCPTDVVAGPPPPAERVCAHLEAIGCIAEEHLLFADGGPVDEMPCLHGYEEARATLGDDMLARVSSCYLAVDECGAVEGCNRACGPDGGIVPFYRDAGPTDAGPTDAGPTDAGPTDAGPTDAGPTDAGPTDAGPTDAGPTDAGPTDAGLTDAGPTDAGPTDAGPTDAGPTDAGPTDAGPTDAG